MTSSSHSTCSERIDHRDVADGDVAQPRDPSSEPSDQPKCVVIAGSARGGTSWVLKVLDSHPKTWGCHEPFVQIQDPDFLRLLKAVRTGEATSDAGRQLVEHFIRPRLGTHKPPLIRKEFLAAPAWLRTWMWMAARVVPPTEGLYRYFSTGKLGGGHVVLVKNRPFPNLPLLLEATGAHVLCLIRHPCAVVSSWWQGIQLGMMSDSPVKCDKVWNLLTASHPDTFGLTRPQLETMSPHSLLALNWLCDYKLMQDIVASSIPSRMVVYADLVNRAEAEWRGIFDWMNLSFDPAVQRFLTQSSRSTFDLRQLLGKRYKYFSTKRNEASPADAWKKKLSAEQIEDVLSVIRPHFDLAQHWPEAAS